MRTHLILAAALLGLASPAFAQDRTLPAGSYEAAQPQIDLRPAFEPAPVLEGRSVEEHGLPVVHGRRSHHRS